MGKPADFEDPFQSGRREARRASLVLNSLVVISAMAGSAFLLYVVKQILPALQSGGTTVEVPTSGVRGTVSYLFGERDGLEVVVRDFDDAAEYNQVLAERIAADLGMDDRGLFYRLTLHNSGEGEMSLRLDEIHMVDDQGKRWEGRWLDQVADAAEASPIGKLRLRQQHREFLLPPGGQRQMEFFIPDTPPDLDSLRSGLLTLADGTIELRRHDIRAGQ